MIWGRINMVRTYAFPILFWWYDLIFFNQFFTTSPHHNWYLNPQSELGDEAAANPHSTTDRDMIGECMLRKYVFDIPTIDIMIKLFQVITFAVTVP